MKNKKSKNMKGGGGIDTPLTSDDGKLYTLEPTIHRINDETKQIEPLKEDDSWAYNLFVSKSNGKKYSVDSVTEDNIVTLSPDKGNKMAKLILSFNTDFRTYTDKSVQKEGYANLRMIIEIHPAEETDVVEESTQMVQEKIVIKDFKHYVLKLHKIIGDVETAKYFDHWKFKTMQENLKVKRFVYTVYRVTNLELFLKMIIIKSL
jgi:hypothetical protein